MDLYVLIYSFLSGSMVCFASDYAHDPDGHVYYLEDVKSALLPKTLACFRAA